MLGAGTQEFPYIPENWDDFVTAVGTVDAYVSLPVEGGTYDMNEIAPEGNFTLNINCAEIQGNEWTIANAFNVHIVILVNYSHLISNLHFLNFLYNSAASETNMFLNTGDNRFEGCKFSGILEGYNKLFEKDAGTMFRCSFNIKFIGGANVIVSPGDYMRFEFCNFKFDHSETTSYSSYNVVMRLDNCLVEDSPTKDEYYIYHKNYYSLNSVVISDNGNYIINGNGDKYTVTDEQLGDAEYLRSLGFPIVQ